MTTADPFWWDANEEDEVRATCRCGWKGKWRDQIRDVRSDERGHVCDQAQAWRVQS